MENFLIGLSSLTTLLNPFMLFAFLLAGTLLIFQLKEKVEKIEGYMKSVAISLAQIAQEL